MPAARVELNEAVAWYDKQVLGLGAQLLDEMEFALRNVQQFPDAWHPVAADIRSHRLNRFPYSLIYARLDADLAILAFAHQHRQPMYWRQRAKGLRGR